MKLAKYQKVEVAIFGVVAPTLLLIHTILSLLSGEAFFWGRGLTVIYHGNEAYYVSLLWFGVSVAMYAFFFLRPLKLLSYSQRKLLIYLSLVLGSIGLLSTFAYV
ncbi:hypothetical protein ACFSJY_18720 [Thalassotalea euphylliae]|uniref:hypothetical protein n=1 Tax=Thalassotalea euphylliae TaxID=1655234 RepID=UPI00362BB318